MVKFEIVGWRRDKQEGEKGREKSEKRRRMTGKIRCREKEKRGMTRAGEGNRNEKRRRGTCEGGRF